MASKAPAKKKAPSKKAAPKAKASPKAEAGGVIEIGPMPLVMHQEITITASKLPVNKTAVITIEPDLRGAMVLKTDPFGQVQASYLPRVSGSHHVAVVCDGVKAERDFDVAAE